MNNLFILHQINEAEQACIKPYLRVCRFVAKLGDKFEAIVFRYFAKNAVPRGNVETVAGSGEMDVLLRPG